VAIFAIPINAEYIMKARIFVSCGQNRESAELEFAGRIAQLLENLGFDPYIALSEQTLRGVKENIFARLSESEYFLFIDFCRELLPNNFHRGSVFCHQELAIAAYLNKEVIAFQEQGISRLEGIMSFLQANSIEFNNRETLISRIEHEVKSRWNNTWRNELQIQRDPNQFADEKHPTNGNPTIPRSVRYFHLNVINNHLSNTALDCYRFLEEIVDCASGKSLDIRLVEYKWRGVQFPGVVIPYHSGRELDAFFVYNDSPNEIHLSSFSDSPKHIHQIMISGDYRLRFAVHSANFKTVRQSFDLHVGNNSVDEITFAASI
jgi:hypothetical protein